jgi:hypothetical protein
VPSAWPGPNWWRAEGHPPPLHGGYGRLKAMCNRCDHWTHPRQRETPIWRLDAALNPIVPDDAVLHTIWPKSGKFESSHLTPVGFIPDDDV